MNRQKHKVVLFLEDNARIVVTRDADPYRGIPNVLIDPDLSAVKGHPPHYWKLLGGRVVPITNEEKIIRDAKLKKFQWGQESQKEFIKRVRKAVAMERAKYVAIAGSIVLGFSMLVMTLLR